VSDWKRQSVQASDQSSRIEYFSSSEVEVVINEYQPIPLAAPSFRRTVRSKSMSHACIRAHEPAPQHSPNIVGQNASPIPLVSLDTLERLIAAYQAVPPATTSCDQVP
jgi:hypothetical protein